MSKRFEVGKYAIDNKSKGTAGPQSTIYKVVSIENVTSGVTYVIEVDELSETDRGAGGFGSTGVR